MKKIGLLFLIGLVMLSCNQNNSSREDASMQEKQIETETGKDGVFIHITKSYDDPHSVLMPMKMAVIMAEDKDVLVYMDIHAVELLVQGAEDLTHEDFESFRSYLKQLLDKNVGVYACPTCLKVAGFSAEDLLDGVQTAQKDKFFTFTKGRILTLDY